jgi:hypothetical protein
VNPAGRAPGRWARHSVDRAGTLAHRRVMDFRRRGHVAEPKPGNQDGEAGVKTGAGHWPPNAEQNTERNQGKGPKSMEAERNRESDVEQKIDRGEALHTGPTKIKVCLRSSEEPNQNEKNISTHETQQSVFSLKINTSTTDSRRSPPSLSHFY